MILILMNLVLMKTATKLTDKNMTKKQFNEFDDDCRIDEDMDTDEVNDIPEETEDQDIFMNIFAEVFGSKK